MGTGICVHFQVIGRARGYEGVVVDLKKSKAQSEGVEGQGRQKIHQNVCMQFTNRSADKFLRG